MGLDVVRVNVERMKGGIRVESAYGRGLTVQLRLPLSLTTARLLLASAGGRLFGLPVEAVQSSRRVRAADVFSLEGRPAVLLDGQPAVAARLADLLRAARPKPAVLLVEDSALVRAMEKRILEDAGYDVTAAVDGIDALNLLGSRPFVAVVSDILMPNLDGLALTARIRSEPRHRDLPVILVTTLASDEDKRRGLEAGANAYLPKPAFDQRVLLETLDRLVAP